MYVCGGCGGGGQGTLVQSHLLSFLRALKGCYASLYSICTLYFPVHQFFVRSVDPFNVCKYTALLLASKDVTV